MAQSDENGKVLVSGLENDYYMNYKYCHGSGRKLKEMPVEWLIKNNICPDCGGELVHESGCKTCYNCGWSACS